MNGSNNPWCTWDLLFQCLYTWFSLANSQKSRGTSRSRRTRTSKRDALLTYWGREALCLTRWSKCAHNDNPNCYCSSLHQSLSTQSSSFPGTWWRENRYHDALLGLLVFSSFTSTIPPVRKIAPCRLIYTLAYPYDLRGMTWYWEIFLEKCRKSSNYIDRKICFPVTYN